MCNLETVTPDADFVLHVRACPVYCLFLCCTAAWPRVAHAQLRGAVSADSSTRARAADI